MTSSITVGKIRDAHGLKGELFVVLFAKRADWSERLNEFQLTRKEQIDGKWVEVAHSFHVKRIKPHKNGLILKPLELDDRTAAESFRGATFEIPLELLTSSEGETIFLKEIDGFLVVNHDIELGPIVGFSSNGSQDILQVNTLHGEALIPLIPEFVESLDFKNKKVLMKLPEGLVPTALS